MRKNIDNPNDLTDEEIVFLKSSSSVPNEVKGYLARQHENLGTKAAAYRKIGHAARTECEMLLALRDLGEVQGELVSIEKAKDVIAQKDHDISALTRENAKKDSRILNLTAAPALAVNSGER